MARYHDTGTICEATKRACPLGLSDSDHIEADSVQEFEEKLAERVSQEGNQFGTSSRSAPLKIEAHPWAGDRLATANSVNRDPKKGDWVAYEDPYDANSIRSGKVLKIGSKAGVPYVVISSGAYEPSMTVWPEGEPRSPKSRQAVAVRSETALKGESEQSWQSQISKDSFDQDLKSWDQVDFAIFEKRRTALTGDEKLHWDDPEEERRYKERWKERYALADAELANRRASGDLGPTAIANSVETPNPMKATPAKGSIASYRAMEDSEVAAAYSTQTQRWWDGYGRGDLAKIERVMEERDIAKAVPLRPWD